VLYRETDTLVDEVAEASIDGTRKECLKFLETVPLLIDDMRMRKLPLTTAEELLGSSCDDMSAPVPCSLKSSCRGLGEAAGGGSRRHRHA